MATGNSNEAENHWPGYVDALTTMLMVLTFVMMILGVAVFAMSQNVSRILIESIARASNLDPPIEDVPVPELVERILDKLRRHPPRPPVQKGTEAAEDRGRYDPGAGEGGAPESARLTSEAPAARAGDAAPARTSASGNAIVIEFKSRATQLDEATAANLHALLSGADALRQASRIDIQAVVDTASSSVTDARRVAYYRAMMVRTAALKAGLPAERIRVRLDEQGREPKADIVRLIGVPAAPGSASP